MPYHYIQRKNGCLDIEFQSTGKRKIKFVCGYIKDRQFRRIDPVERDVLEGLHLSYIQSLAAYKALKEGKIGPL